MATEVVGQVPGIDIQFALTLVNRAWVDIQRKFLWSFLWGDASVPTLVPVTAGTVTTVLGSNTVTGDANASAAWATGFSFVIPITVCQFRVGQGTIYNILAADFTVPTAVVLTLDRQYVDAPSGLGGGVGYTISQNYFNAPTQDFIWWESMRDPVSGYDFTTTNTREWVDGQDPQRFQSGWPIGPIPYLINPWPGNFQYYPMYELWPGPVSGYTYVGTYFRKGMPFANYSDTVNPPLGEDAVLALAKQYAYEWAGANQDRVKRVPKADYRYWAGYAEKQYDGLIDDYILMDESFSHRHIIESAQVSYTARLPWVSQSTGYAFFPS
jgi:hypothetical protein